MLQVARLAPNELREASDRVVDYLHGQFNEDGGCKDRSGASDLYYTVFGLAGLAALRAEPPTQPTRSYLESFAAGDDLDVVHLCCLARCWASLAPKEPPALRDAMLANLERFRSRDGGYGAEPDAEHGTVYHCFLALGARQDLGAEALSADGLIDCVDRLSTDDGAFANEAGLPLGTTPATAAAVTLLRNLGAPVPAPSGAWLLRQATPEGGFLAMPRAPMPDLLSTATALHALAGLEIPFEEIKTSCLDFVDTLWTGQAFCGNWSDDCPDAEYTYYALLALGHLSL